MDNDHFDDLSRAVARLYSRRALTVSLGIAALGIVEAADARKKKKKRKKRKKNDQQKVVFNDFGCVNVGNFCQNDGQCCSNICTGSACQAHDASTCQAGQQEGFCGGVAVECLAPGGNDGQCQTTTGNAGYCFADRTCSVCTKDADCTSLCGPDAACILCEGCAGTGGTACAGPVPESCP